MGRSPNKQEAWAQAHASPPEGGPESIADALGSAPSGPLERSPTPHHRLPVTPPVHDQGMTTWTTFQTAEPDLAERARTILASTVNAVLGTLRADGSPRLSGIDPFFVAGELWIGSMPDARKGTDLRRDPRCSLHGIPWESRKVKEGGTDPGEGDVKIAGRAVLLDDPEEQANVMAWFKEERGFEPPGPADLFRIDLESVVVISVEDEQFLVIDRWSAATGRRTIRRT